MFCYSNTRYHLSRLHCLVRHWSGKPFCLQDSIKSHNMTDHYPAQVKALGHSIKAHGCEIGERSHKDFVHDPFKQTSRRRKEMLMEMMLIQKRKKIASILQKSIDQASNSDATHDDNSVIRHDDNATLNRNQIRSSRLLVLQQDGVYKLFKIQKTKRIRIDSSTEHMHYMLNPSMLARLLQRHWRIDYFNLPGQRCWLRKSIRISSQTSTSFIVRANPGRSFNRYDPHSRYHNDFSFVRIRVIGNDELETCLCKILAIVEVENERVDLILRAMVMETCDERTDSDMPYHSFKFSENFVCSSLDKILSPACVIPRGLTDTTIFELDTSTENQHYYEIPVDRITKSIPISYNNLSNYCTESAHNEDRCFRSEETINQWAYNLEELHNNINQEKNQIRLEKQEREHKEKMKKIGKRSRN